MAVELTIGARIAEVRGRSSQAAFATKIGVHKNTVGRIERNEYVPDGEFLQALYREFGINPTWVLTGRGEKYAPLGEPLGMDCGATGARIGVLGADETIGQRIAVLRNRESQKAFATRLCVHTNTLSNYERDERPPSADFLLALRRELGVNPDWVLTGRGDKYVSLGALLGEALGMTGLGTADELARFVGVDERTLQKYLDGAEMPDRAFLEHFAAVTGYPLEKLEAAQRRSAAAVDHDRQAEPAGTPAGPQAGAPAESQQVDRGVEKEAAAKPLAPVVGAIIGGERAEADELRKLVAHVDKWEKGLREEGYYIDADLKTEIIVFAWTKIKAQGYREDFVNKLLKLALS